MITETKISINPNSEIQQTNTEKTNYTNRAQWLRAAILGANDGLVSVTSLMIGIGAVKHDLKAMFLSGLAGLIAGACSMAIGEFVSVHSQLDIELAKLKRENKDGILAEEEKLPNPVQAAMASGMAFSIGGLVPLLGGGFISSFEVRVWVVVVTASLGLGLFGCVGAWLGKARVFRSGIRVLVGGWVAMSVTFGFMKLFRSAGL